MLNASTKQTINGKANQPSALNLEKLVLENQETLKKYIYRRLWNKQNLEDIFQTTILEAIRSRHTFNHQSHPKYWLMGIASNVIKNSARKEGVVLYSIEASQGHSFLDEIIGDREKDPAELYEQEQLFDAIENAYNQLPKKMKTVIQEVVKNGMSYAEIAEKHGIVIGTVRSRISRAREIIRNHVSNS